MAEIRIKDNESLDSALRRFKKQCARAGVIAEVRKREAYEKPSVKRKKKSEAARKSKQMNENGKAGNYARFFDYLQHFKRRFDNGSITPYTGSEACYGYYTGNASCYESKRHDFRC